MTHHEEGDAEVEEVTGYDGEEDGAGDGEGLQEEVRHEHPSQDLRAEFGREVTHVQGSMLYQRTSHLTLPERNSDPCSGRGRGRAAWRPRCPTGT